MSKIEPSPEAPQTNKVGFEHLANDEKSDAVQPPPPPPPPTIDRLAGYENVGHETELHIPAPIYQPMINANIPKPDFQTVPILTENEARDILIEYAKQKCCYGVKPAKDLTFTDLQSSNSYRYLLKSFYETRSTQWVYESFHGQPIINNGQAPPDAWSINVNPSEMFHAEIRKLEIPNTANVKVCHTCTGIGTIICRRCMGMGRNRCTWCHGSGWRNQTVYVNNHHTHRSVRCSSCFGRGYVSCSTCLATGRVRCPSCMGTTRLKWYIQLTVNFSLLEDDFLKKSEDIPDLKLRTCQGMTTFTEQNPRVTPINNHSEMEVNKASSDLILLHLNKLKSSRLLMQLQLVVAIPVTLCKYKFKEKDYEYDIYGLEKHVHEIKYPYSCCWCCTIS